jgi:DnaD/phage-associated family protein
MRNRQTDADYARLCTKFESEGFGTLTQIMGEDINALLNEFPVDWIDEAMTVSVQANKRQLRYVRGILVKWRSDGRNDRKPSQNGQAPPPQLLTLKQWCLKTYHTDNPKFADVPEAKIYEQYNQYRSQQQQTH